MSDPDNNFYSISFNILITRLLDDVWIIQPLRLIIREKLCHACDL